MSAVAPADCTGFADRVRARALIALALLQPLAGRLAEITGRGVSIAQRSRASRGPVTPADGAFVIWLPIFLANIALGLRRARGPRGDPLTRRIDWLAGIALASNSAWSLQAQFRGLGWPSVGIIGVGTTCACAALVDAERARGASPQARFAARSLGPLAGWLTVATFANIDAALSTAEGRGARRPQTARALALIGGASAAAAGMSVASRGNLGYAAAAGWGLGGIALRNARDRNRAVTVAAVVGLVAVGAVTAMVRGAERAARRS